MAERTLQRSPLSERPGEWRLLGIFGPGRDRTIDAYNNAFERLMKHGEGLRQRYQSGEQLTPSELMTLVDSQITYHGRHNLNASGMFIRIGERIKGRATLTPEQRKIREDYQTGDYQGIAGTDEPLSYDIPDDRLVYPVADQGKNLAIEDGAAVEGMISFIDQEIQSVKTRRIGFSPFAKIKQLWDLYTLRSQRNVLFTQSTEIFNIPDKVSHGRNQLESFAGYLDPLRSNGELPDWFIGEKLLGERRVLNIPLRGNQRWLIGLLPVAPLIPLIVWQALHPVTVPVQIEANPCPEGVLDREIFDESDPEKVSIDGAIEREMAYFRLGIPQDQYRPDNDPEMVAEVERLRAKEPDYYETYLKVAKEDYNQTAVRLSVDGKDVPWIRNGAREFKRKLILPSCLTPEMRDQKVRQILGDVAPKITELIK